MNYVMHVYENFFLLLHVSTFSITKILFNNTVPRSLLFPRLSKISVYTILVLVHLGPGLPEVGPPVVQVYEEHWGGGEHDEPRHAEVDQQHVAGDAEGEVPAQCQCVSTVPLSAPH